MASFIFDRWKVESYAHGWQVAELMESAETGAEYTAHPTYHPTLIGALNNLVEVRARAADTTDLRALIAVVREHRDEVRDFLSLRIGG